MVAPEPEGEPPGSTSRVRALYELLTAYDRTLSDSTAITADLTPRNWSGPASESYQQQAKNPFEAQLRTVQEINAAVLDDVGGHQDFRIQLATLWQDPHERAHMRTVHRNASDELAARLFAKAAELDRVANFDEVQHAPADPAELPVPRPVPGPSRVGRHPVSESDEERDGPHPPATSEPRDEQEEHNAPGDDSTDDGSGNDNLQAVSGGDTGHNGHGVLPPGTTSAVGARDETERAAWLRTIPVPRTLRTDIFWNEDDDHE